MNKLTQIQKEFLNIIECFMHDKAYTAGINGEAWPELKKLSKLHNVTAAVYETVRRDEELTGQTYEMLMHEWKGNAIREVLWQTQRTYGFLDIYRKFMDAGVKPLVVKGIICRNLYTKSDYRVSGDEDMLVRMQDFETYDSILIKEGFLREDVDKENLPYEISYINKENGVYIEMHFSLFPKESGAYGHLNQEFARIYKSCISEQIQGTQVWTLDPTMHLFYLICHSFKHFLHSGFGIRQVCDMVMMAEHYKEQIDWKCIEEKLSRQHMVEFWAGIARIGIAWLGFDCEEAYLLSDKNQALDEGDLLLDILNSGIYGGSTVERKHSSNITLAAAEKGHKDMAAAFAGSFFPEREYMTKHYTYLKQYPWLLPVAWGSRIIKYLGHSAKRQKTTQSIVEIGMERIKLLKKYGIIK